MGATGRLRVPGPMPLAYRYLKFLQDVNAILAILSSRLADFYPWPLTELAAIWLCLGSG